MKTYKEFISEGNKPKSGFRYEDSIINPILQTIEQNQDYLTQPENLPQLAKLGYIFNTLWYVGRITYGYNGTISQNGDCESNPRDVIEDDINYHNREIEDLVYDSWGMHASYEGNHPTYEQFIQKLSGRQLTDYDRKRMKINKTFDEWVDVLTDERYPYHSIYPNRRSVANHLLCTIGNGYGYRNGYVIQEASGADQDVDLYGDWENANFSPNIQTVIDRILSYPELQEAVDSSHNFMEEIYGRERERERERWGKFRSSLGDDDMDLDMKKEILKMRDTMYHPYYPISKNFSIITKFDEKTHSSYIRAGIEICQDILNHEKEERKSNVEFAKNFLNKFNDDVEDYNVEEWNEE